MTEVTKTIADTSSPLTLFGAPVGLWTGKIRSYRRLPGFLPSVHHRRLSNSLGNRARGGRCGRGPGSLTAG